MNTVSLVGIDLGKHCFHLHAQDVSGKQVLRKKLTRSQMFTLLGNFPSCTVVMELAPVRTGSPVNFKRWATRPS
ncbi:hypothetical protein CSX04_05549 [Burkholderia cepacia]|nr:hypothetical protein CSX04_05549 [Burkholderia cepacia]